MKTLELTSTTSGKTFKATYEMFHPAVSGTQNAWYKQARIIVNTPFGEQKASYYKVNGNQISIVTDFYHNEQRIRAELVADCPEEIKEWYLKERNLYKEVEKAESDIQKFLDEA